MAKKWSKEEIEALIINYEGVYARDLAIETGRTPLAIRLKARKLGLKSMLKNKGNGLDHRGMNNPNWGRKGKSGKDNPMWKGNNAKSPAFHSWLKRHHKKLDKCEECKNQKKLTLANMNNHNYTRDIKDYKWLCEKCHRRMDVSKRNRER